MLDLVTATMELALARLTLKRTPLAPHAVNARRRPGNPDGAVERVCLAIARMSVRVPWRADCLVRARAGQRWLARLGIATTLELGAKPGANLDAHAWLRAGNDVLIGGDVAGYSPFRPSHSRPGR